MVSLSLSVLLLGSGESTVLEMGGVPAGGMTRTAPGKWKVPGDTQEGRCSGLVEDTTKSQIRILELKKKITEIEKLDGWIC